jgi:hypothetical protein
MWSQATKDALHGARRHVVLRRRCSAQLGGRSGLGPLGCASAAELEREDGVVPPRRPNSARLHRGRSVPWSPGSGERGLRRGAVDRHPIGYYGDPVKSAEPRFGSFAGKRCGRCRATGRPSTADGVDQRCSGRGSVCINTAGEKVFPEEVEEALKTHPGCVTPWRSACPIRASARPSVRW